MFICHLQYFYQLHLIFFILVEVSNEGLRREVTRGRLCLLQFLIFRQLFCGAKKYIGYLYKLMCVLYPSDQGAYCKGVKVQFPDWHLTKCYPLIEFPFDRKKIRTSSNTLSSTWREMLLPLSGPFSHEMHISIFSFSWQKFMAMFSLDINAYHLSLWKCGESVTTSLSLQKCAGLR